MKLSKSGILKIYNEAYEREKARRLDKPINEIVVKQYDKISVIKVYDEPTNGKSYLKIWLNCIENRELKVKLTSFGFNVRKHRSGSGGFLVDLDTSNGIGSYEADKIAHERVADYLNELNYDVYVEGKQR